MLEGSTENSCYIAIHSRLGGCLLRVPTCDPCRANRSARVLKGTLCLRHDRHAQPDSTRHARGAEANGQTHGEFSEVSDQRPASGGAARARLACVSGAVAPGRLVTLAA